MFSHTIKLFSVRGFDIKLDPSWLIIAALITWSLGQYHFPTAYPGESAGTYLLMAFVAMICFFASLLLHELSHAIVARSLGLPMGGITLFLFGGVAEMEAEPKSAPVEFWVAVAGPVMSLVLALGFWFLALIGRLAGLPETAGTVLSYLAMINLILALFNLVPAFPLDGGRILRAWLWHRHGDILRATETAAQSGAAFAYLLMGLGIIGLFQGAFVAALWQIMIGGFILMAARASYQQQLTQSVFGNRTVADLMQRTPVTVGPERTLSDFVDHIILRDGLSFVPVVEGGVLLGHIDKAMLSAIDRDNWSSTRVGDVFAGLNGSLTIAPEMPVQEFIRTIGQSGHRKFLVVGEHRLVGVISLSDVVRHLQLYDLVVKRGHRPS